jgi:tripartite-type tricarboxylate transporter receptor subunit TctC
MHQDSFFSCRLHRRLVLRGADIAVAIGVLAGIAGVTIEQALAQGAYPTKPIRIVVGFAAGGPADIVARVVGAKVGDLLGQQVVVENRGGAGGTIATEAVARADADGYTLLLSPLANAVNETLVKNFRYKVGEQLMAVAPLAETANVLVVHPSLGVKSVADLIALAKAKPGEVLYATAGRGTATHLTSELFNVMAGTKLAPVHYKGGGDTVKDLLSGEVKVMFSSIAPVLAFVKDGRLLGLATTGPKRDPALPELPTIAESGLPGFDMRLWLGLLAPAGTPKAVIDRLSSATTAALDAPEIKAALAKQGFAPLAGSPAHFDAFYRGEVAKWRKVIEATGMATQ